MRYYVLYLVDSFFVGSAAIAALPNVNQAAQIVVAFPVNAFASPFACLCMILLYWCLVEVCFRRVAWAQVQTSQSTSEWCQRRRAREAYFRIKRMLDVGLSLFLIFLTIPFLGLIWLATRFDLGGRALFIQERPGRAGQPFSLFKFRTMKAGGGAFETPDMQISTFGCFLRRFRLDELPQLFNILKGDMSFVGPRPLLPADQPDDVTTRLSVPPGLTGWAQVNGGRALSRQDKARLDADYVANASVFFDLKILVLTIRFVLAGERISIVRNVVIKQST